MHNFEVKDSTPKQIYSRLSVAVAPVKTYNIHGYI